MNATHVADYGAMLGCDPALLLARARHWRSWIVLRTSYETPAGSREAVTHSYAAATAENLLQAVRDWWHAADRARQLFAARPDLGKWLGTWIEIAGAAHRRPVVIDPADLCEADPAAALFDSNAPGIPTLRRARELLAGVRADEARRY